ncbi:MAG: CDP-alcohol phosphatidyltransferase family protein [Thermus sp.]|uniref:CDP-alcohol phosphatidyltransferase family protein n=1 Tax=Thermus sp. TaxID=275 RepID=UPI0025F0E3E0|nr:CDP-alcohol phosphatidyltransferase family protein [Thermus sp.]MCS6868297.1 CDP-alcohol phosphatidyltransferase family protein [Thermus sp.]MCS7218204.1 CDP-alcohol phosphatidyltransferase family protein [Thermus sp.]MDW8017083.1 CDP-alcohol phosphatidyltransferase family protein [Thermus sp.]MDW8356353.1 CDP-alcohol phosphatidyltransferase family protein [Thermus sp.]
MVPGAKARPVQEFLNVLLYRPLAHLLVLLLYPTPLKPHHLVLFHTGLVLFAAWLLLEGEDLWAALLLQLKTVLDNADGQLARLRKEVTELGRYLDTELDLLGNLALFLALGARTGAWGMALAAFLVFTLVQSYDFNLERLYREARGFPLPQAPKDPDTPGLRLLRGVYRLLFGPQDRGIEALERFLQARLGLSRERFWDEAALAGVVNLGLTTQLFFLGLFLLFHQPGAYLTFALLQALYLGLWYLWRIIRAIPSPR